MRMGAKAWKCCGFVTLHSPRNEGFNITTYLLPGFVHCDKLIVRVTARWIQTSRMALVKPKESGRKINRGTKGW